MDGMPKWVDVILVPLISLLLAGVIKLDDVPAELRLHRV